MHLHSLHRLHLISEMSAEEWWLGLMMPHASRVIDLARVASRGPTRDLEQLQYTVHAIALCPCSCHCRQTRANRLLGTMTDCIFYKPTTASAKYAPALLTRIPKRYVQHDKTLGRTPRYLDYPGPTHRFVRAVHISHFCTAKAELTSMRPARARAELFQIPQIPPLTPLTPRPLQPTPSRPHAYHLFSPSYSS